MSNKRLGTNRLWLTGLVVVFVACHTLVNAEVPQSTNNALSGKGAGANAAGPPAVVKRPLDKEQMIKDDPYGKLVQNKGIVDLGFIHAFVASLSVIIVSELGDKTFFISAIMSMRHSRLTVYLGAIVALIFMTIMSALLGFATTVIPRWLTYYTSSALFAIFGIRMLREGYYMSPDEGQEEYEEVQADLRKRDEEAEKGSHGDVETGTLFSRLPYRRFLYGLFSRVFLQSMTLNFLAEWGDRSQISTIILAAREEVFGVILGASIGHMLCTGLAVLGGRFIAQKISIRTVTLVGGIVFILFALSALVIEPDD